MFLASATNQTSGPRKVLLLRKITSFAPMEDARLVESDSLKMEILPALGARVRSLRYQGTELLSGADQHADNWGATYWTSPQADWGWPPVAAVDTDAYGSLGVTGGMAFRSQLAEFGGRRLHIEKHFRKAAGGTIDTEYVIENVGSSEFRMASWEISRVPAGGLTFFPTGTSEISPVPPHFELVMEKIEGTSFFDHAGFVPGKSRKIHADGSGGYLAHLAGGLLLLKIFEDSQSEAQAPAEGECEIFANLDGKYVEVEVQGPYSLVKPGERSSFTVRTAVVELPQGLSRADRRGLRAFADSKVHLLRS